MRGWCQREPEWRQARGTCEAFHALPAPRVVQRLSCPHVALTFSRSKFTVRYVSECIECRRSTLHILFSSCSPNVQLGG